MDVLDCWKREIEKISGQDTGNTGGLEEIISPSLPDFSHKDTIFISSASAAKNLIREARVMKLSHIGLNTLFTFDGHLLAGDVLEPDIQTIRPYLLAVTLVESSKTKNNVRLHNYVINLRVKSLHRIIKRLFWLPVCFVGYELNKTLFCLWHLNVSGPEMLWDVLIHEKAIYLGHYHQRSKSNPSNDIFNHIRQKVEGRELAQFQMEWTSICHRYGVPYNNKYSKHIEDSIFNHSRLEPYTAKQINYVTGDAIAAARIYLHQINTAAQLGVLHHLIKIEMPFITTAARIEWTGVGFNQERYDTVKDECKKAIKKLKKRIAKHGIGNPLSHKELQQFFRRTGLLNLFSLHGQYSFEKEQLKRNIGAHPVISDLINYRRLNNLIASASKLADFVSFDDRVHAQYDSIGSVSGRLTTQNPNIIGLDSRLRHLIIPEPGKGIGEVDWCQFEVGITAAVYGDEKLLKMFNSGDVYTLMAKEFFKDKLSNLELELSDRRFKQRFLNLRNKMKICVLGIIYGMEPYTISKLLKCSKKEAQQLYRKFLQMFPMLKKATDETHTINKCCGSSSTVTGLRRHRSTIDSGQMGKENWLINHPIQGTAATIFKATANRLDKLYRPHGAQIIIPMHDAFVFEAPTEALCEVAELTERVMCETVREFFPELQPKVEVNISDPTCWGQKEKLAKSL